MATVAQLEARMLDVLKADTALAARMKASGGTFRLGSLPGKADTVGSLPLVYVAAGRTYIESRMSLGGPPRPGVSPAESVTYVIEVVCVSRPAGTPRRAQESAYGLADMAIGALSRNLVLHDGTGADPLAHDIRMATTERDASRMGTDLEAVTVMCHVTSVVEHSGRQVRAP